MGCLQWVLDMSSRCDGLSVNYLEAACKPFSSCSCLVIVCTGGRADLPPSAMLMLVSHTCLTHACLKGYKRKLIVSRPYATKCPSRQGGHGMATRLTSKLPLKVRHSRASTGMATATDIRLTPPNTPIWDEASGGRSVGVGGRLQYPAREEQAWGAGETSVQLVFQPYPEGRAVAHLLPQSAADKRHTLQNAVGRAPKGKVNPDRIAVTDPRS